MPVTDSEDARLETLPAIKCFHTGGTFWHIELNDRSRTLRKDQVSNLSFLLWVGEPTLKKYQKNVRL